MWRSRRQRPPQRWLSEWSELCLPSTTVGAPTRISRAFAERCDAYCDAIDAANPKGSSSPCAAASQHEESERKR